MIKRGIPQVGIFFLYLLLPLSLPLRFIFARLLYYLLYYITGYQKKVTRKRLTQSFPEIPAVEIKATEKNFPRKKKPNISHLFLENIIKRTASTLAVAPLVL
ncbi:hypothetical protein [Pedobacter zeae]|uniref:Lauroyl/myristoyl acyltransferase n=1 Tax=Pedobacter zeae TaxID=1737356 RepID=A0A7W6K880_9SPHI|nr:hypothetical protein [Pedobacter zeae]MBB4106991.1 lauroyl/myristoyl acyltransferase [Pedobacter zeae]